MAAGDSQTSITNAALIALGEDLITSPADQTKAAILSTARWDPVRRRVLQSFPWKSAKQLWTFSLSTYVPPITYGYAYALPADCLRVWDLPDNDGAMWEVGQDIAAGRLLLTDQGPPLSGVYIRDLTDPTLMDAQLVDVLALELAIELCEPLTQSTAKLQGLQARLKATREEARLTDSDQENPREWDEDIWLRARR